MTLKAGSLSSITRNLRNNIPVVAMIDGNEYPIYAALMREPGEATKEGEDRRPRLVLSLDAPAQEPAPGEEEGASLEPAGATIPEPSNEPGYGNNGGNG